MPADPDARPADVSSDGPHPRAFVTATGFIFQIAGLVLAGGGCCLWSASGCLQRERAVPITSVMDYFRSDARGATIGMIAVTGSFVAGLGLLAAGIGLQGERPAAGRWAVAVTALLALLWWGSGVALLFVAAELWQLGLAALLAAISTVLFLLAGNSARILRLHPPPPNHNVVTDEFLKEYSSRRHE